jgi:hypothetical protein
MNCALQEQRTGVNTRGKETGAQHNHKHNLLLAVMEEIDLKVKLKYKLRQV